MNIASDKDLAEFIADHLPITIEIAQRFIDSSLQGYYFDPINYGMALSLRDKMIVELQEENRKLFKRIYSEK